MRLGSRRGLPQTQTVARNIHNIVYSRNGAFRIVYVAKFSDAVHVLHCFQKKTQRTSKQDLDLAATRYRDLLKELKK